MKTLSIGEVAVRSGINASALRYYESIHLLPSAARVGGKRRYDDSILIRLQIIEIAKSLDFSLDEIKLLLQGVSETSSPSKVWRAFAKIKLDVIQEQINRAQLLHKILKIGLSCQCLRLSDCTLPDSATLS